MKIEIVEYYPIPNPTGKMLGTMHIYVCNLKMDIRGVEVYKIKGQYIFKLPQKWGIEDEKRIWYPVISFTDNQTQKDFVRILRNMGRDFMEHYEEDFKKIK